MHVRDCSCARYDIADFLFGLIELQTRSQSKHLDENDQQLAKAVVPTLSCWGRSQFTSISLSILDALKFAEVRYLI